MVSHAHLSYNNFLILLCRPYSRVSVYSEDYEPHDAEFCSISAVVITSIFEELRQKDHLEILWCSGVYALHSRDPGLSFSNLVLAIDGSTLHCVPSVSGPNIGPTPGRRHHFSALRTFEASPARFASGPKRRGQSRL